MIFMENSDAELFAKPTVLFLGGKSTGKTSLVNYLLGIDSTPWQLKTGII
jgi:nicotinamide riboside kinase